MGMEGLMPRKPLTDKGMQTSLRLPRELHDRLAMAAGDKGIGEEIRRRLEASFASEPPTVSDPRFADLLSAIGYTASAAARMYPAKRATISRSLAHGLCTDEQIEQGDYTVEDISA